ncbi:hypothetical protein [Calothrix sp. NIES-2098]|uniref:hypothetical protein n=1 Tax=Calothrix sp. NIES-2098 TaxID=1954171 RepID=UPI0030DC06B4
MNQKRRNSIKRNSLDITHPTQQDLEVPQHDLEVLQIDLLLVRDFAIASFHYPTLSLRSALFIDAYLFDRS